MWPWDGKGQAAAEGQRDKGQGDWMGKVRGPKGKEGIDWGIEKEHDEG